MNVKRNQVEQNNQAKCKSCLLFYGAQATQGLCSSCYKKNKISVKQQTKIEQLNAQKSTEILPKNEKNQSNQQKKIQNVQKDKKRCFNCNKKLGLLGVECKCGFVFCNNHRLPEQHSCNFNYAEEGKKKLQKENVKIYNGKITQL